MSSVTSQLTVQLVDRVSGPSRAISSALKAASSSAMAVSKALSGTGASRNFVNQLSKLGLSAKEVDKVSRALADYSKISGIAGRATTWTKEQTAQIRAWEATTIASLQRVKTAQAESAAAAKAASDKRVEATAREREQNERLVQSHRRAAAAAEARARHEVRFGHRSMLGYSAATAAGAVSAHSITHQVGRTIKAGANLQHEITALKNAGRTSKEMEHIMHVARDTTRAVPTSTYADNLKVINETTGAFGDLHHAIENLPFMQKSASVLHATAGDKIHDNAGELANKMARFFEMRGTAIDSPLFRKEAEQMVRAMVFSRGNFNPAEMLLFGQQATPGSLANYNMRFLSKIAPSLVTEFGGDRAGTAANAFRNVIMGKARDKKQAEAWQKLGLLDRSKAITAAGHAVSWTAGAIKNTDLALQDPLEWAESTLLPALKAKGVNIDDSLALTKELGVLFRNSMANRFAEAITQARSRKRLHMDEKNINATGGLDEIYKRNLATDPTVAITAFTAAMENFASAVSGPTMEAIASGLTTLGGHITSFANLLKDHPNLAVAGGVATAGAALGGAGWLSYKLATGFGLSASAAALDVSAGLLDKAAMKLMGTPLQTLPPGSNWPPAMVLPPAPPAGPAWAPGAALSGVGLAGIAGVTMALGAGVRYGIDHYSPKSAVEQADIRDRIGKLESDIARAKAAEKLPGSAEPLLRPLVHELQELRNRLASATPEQALPSFAHRADGRDTAGRKLDPTSPDKPQRGWPTWNAFPADQGRESERGAAFNKLTSDLSNVGVKADEAKAKLDGVGSANVAPRVDASGLDTLINKADTALSKMRELESTAKRVGNLSVAPSVGTGVVGRTMRGANAD